MPATSSAFAPAEPLAAEAEAPETRVWGLNSGERADVGASSHVAAGKHLGISLLGCEVASDRIYAVNNPVMHTDRTGLLSMSAENDGTLIEAFDGFPVSRSRTL